jgi:hypothetical protein
MQQILQKNWKLLIDWQFLLQLFLEDGNKYVMQFYLSIQSKFCAIVVGYERGYEEALWERTILFNTSMRCGTLVDCICKVQVQNMIYYWCISEFYITYEHYIPKYNETKIYQLFKIQDFV